MKTTTIDDAREAQIQMRKAIVAHDALQALYSDLAAKHEDQKLGPFFNACFCEQASFVCGVRALGLRLEMERQRQ